MSKVITFSRKFQKGHPRVGEQTHFVEKIMRHFLIEHSPMFPYWMQAMEKNELNIRIRDCYDYKPKFHTIRAGNRFKVGDTFSPRVWSDKPYRSEQIVIAPDIEVKKIWDILIAKDLKGIRINRNWFFENYESLLFKLATNDGLSVTDFLDWFPSYFEGQIICWSDNINY